MTGTVSLLASFLFLAAIGPCSSVAAKRVVRGLDCERLSQRYLPIMQLFVMSFAGSVTRSLIDAVDHLLRRRMLVALQCAYALAIARATSMIRD